MVQKFPFYRSWGGAKIRILLESQSVGRGTRNIKLERNVSKSIVSCSGYRIVGHQTVLQFFHLIYSAHAQDGPQDMEIN